MPAADGAGHGQRRLRPTVRNMTFTGVEIQRSQGTGGTAGVNRDRIALRRNNQPETVAPQAVHVRVNHRDSGGRGDHRLNGVAAFAQDRQRAFAGEVMRRDRHAQWRGVAVNHFLALF
ncbi:hypothetical protein D3C79_547040 [compost metagenome]